jgi:hypothetical protein
MEASLPELMPAERGEQQAAGVVEGAHIVLVEEAHTVLGEAGVVERYVAGMGTLVSCNCKDRRSRPRRHRLTPEGLQGPVGEAEGAPWACPCSTVLLEAGLTVWEAMAGQHV